MLTNKMEIDSRIDKTINNEIESNKIYESQKSFLESDLGKTINLAFDFALKSILPDLIENEVIDIKNIIMNQGFSDGIKEIISSGIDMGKSISGIVTGNFENFSQVEMAIKKGGLIDKISKVFDVSIDLADKNNLINKNISSTIKKGKNTIISTISENIEKRFSDQIKSIEKVEKYCEIWNDAYLNKDFNSMEKAYKNIEKNLNKIVPFENIIKEARKIENIHNLIKNNNESFDISEEQEILAQKLC